MTDGNDLPTIEPTGTSRTSDTEGHMPVKWHAAPTGDDQATAAMEPDETIRVRPVAEPEDGDAEGHMPVKWHAAPTGDDQAIAAMDPEEAVKWHPVAEPDPGWRIPATDIDADVEGHASRSGFDTAPPASDGGIGPDEAAKFRP